MKLEFFYEETRVVGKDAAGNELAELTFPTVRPGVVNINFTYLDDSLRGEGMGGGLLEFAVAEFRKRNIKALVSCPYAIKWFSKHPEASDVML